MDGATRKPRSGLDWCIFVALRLELKDRFRAGSSDQTVTGETYQPSHSDLPLVDVHADVGVCSLPCYCSWSTWRWWCDGTIVSKKGEKRWADKCFDDE